MALNNLEQTFYFHNDNLITAKQFQLCASASGDATDASTNLFSIWRSLVEEEKSACE